MKFVSVNKLENDKNLIKKKIDSWEKNGDMIWFDLSFIILHTD